MSGFHGLGPCCCGCTKIDYNFATWDSVDATKLEVLSGDWSIVDGCLQTSSDNAQIAFLPQQMVLTNGNLVRYLGLGEVSSLPMIVEVDNLGSGAELVFSPAATANTGTEQLVVFKGGSSGSLSITNYEETFAGTPTSSTGEEPKNPANLPTSFKLYNNYSGVLDAQYATTRGGWSLQTSEDASDYWRTLIGPTAATIGTKSFGTRSLGGSALRIKRIRFMKADATCLDTPEFLWCPNATLNVGAKNGYYVTLAGFSGGFSDFNGTYHLNADNYYTYQWEGTFSSPSNSWNGNANHWGEYTLTNPALAFWCSGVPYMDYRSYNRPWYTILSIHEGIDNYGNRLSGPGARNILARVMWGTAGTTLYAAGDLADKMPLLSGAGGTVQRTAMAWDSTALFLNYYIWTHDSLTGSATITSDPVWPS